MSDQINVNTPDSPNSNINSILRELSDLKADLKVNNNETKNIGGVVDEIKSDLKIIKSDFICRREMGEALAVIRDEIAPLRKFVYFIIGVFGLAVLGAIANLIINK